MINSATRKQLLLIIALTGLIFLVCNIFISTNSEKVSTPTVIIGQTSIPVEVVEEEADLKKGLSGRAYLSQESGMLFIFQKADVYQFWMPDMHFPIDIIWINNNKVAGITRDVSNEFDPSHPVFYSPPEPVQYVLEVNAGFALSHDIKTGDPVIF